MLNQSLRNEGRVGDWESLLWNLPIWLEKIKYATMWASVHDSAQLPNENKPLRWLMVEIAPVFLLGTVPSEAAAGLCKYNNGDDKLLGLEVAYINTHKLPRPSPALR
jgi:hypothetical protein